MTKRRHDLLLTSLLKYLAKILIITCIEFLIHLLKLTERNLVVFFGSAFSVQGDPSLSD